MYLPTSEENAFIVQTLREKAVELFQMSSDSKADRNDELRKKAAWCSTLAAKMEASTNV